MNKSYRLLLLVSLFFVSTTQPMVRHAKFILGASAAIGIASAGYHIWKNYWLGRHLDDGIRRGVAPVNQELQRQGRQLEELQQGMAELRDSAIPQIMEKLQLLENTTGLNRTMLTLIIKMHFAQLTEEQRALFFASIEGMELSEEIRELFRVAVPN